MGLPALLNWEGTRDALHQIALVVGAIRVACTDPLANDLHFSVDVTESGISTMAMRCGGALLFDFADLQLRFERGGESVFAIDVRGHSQLTLMRRLLDVFSDCGYRIRPSMKHIRHETEFELDPGGASDFLKTLDAVYTALARFRAKLSGSLTPLVLWPHHFDLAFIYFPGGGGDEHADPQIAFGFAPFSPGLDRPYFYAYAWSAPTGYVQVPLEAPAQAIAAGYTGLYAAYDDLHNSSDFNALVERILQTYRRLASAQLP